MEKRYNELSKELCEKIKAETKDMGLLDNSAIRRRQTDSDTQSLWRPSYVRDVEKILHSPFYNRYTDKTQVFSFYKNDDISRRGFHVQLVSRIARNIGRLLGLNLDLIEAIALGHDIGHTPFGHAGEWILNDISLKVSGRFFNHNVHSVRVLDGILHHNISLQTLDGILCHNGEMELKEYRPEPLSDFATFDKKVEECYLDKNAVKRLVPMTLEGCIVRISDIIAYLGKDRQDAIKMNKLSDEDMFKNNPLGRYNAEIINNLIVSIVENSYGKDYIMMDDECFEGLKQAKKENYDYIYLNTSIEEKVRPLMFKMYDKLYDELSSENKESYIFKHHIDYIAENGKYYGGRKYLEENLKEQIVIDFIASMTDDYFIDLYGLLFPNEDTGIKYHSYFEKK